MASIEDIQRAYIAARQARDGSENRADTSHHSVVPVEPTLGDSIIADRPKAVGPCQFCGRPVSTFGHIFGGRPAHGSCIVERA